MCCAAAAPRAATSLLSATSARSGTQSNPPNTDGPKPDSFRFLKSSRLLRRSEFRKVYDEGARLTSPFFAAFCLRWPEQESGPRVGFTVSRAQGKAVIRNRMRRRLREAVRLHLHEVSREWAIVFNPRRAVLEAPFPAIEREVQRVFSRCRSAE
jgi:ribonuclease P protein component